MRKKTSISMQGPTIWALNAGLENLGPPSPGRLWHLHLYELLDIDALFNIRKNYCCQSPLYG